MRDRRGYRTRLECSKHRRMNGKPDPPATPLWLALAFLAFSALSWAGSSVAGRAASGNIPPFTLSFIRWLCVFLCFLAIGWRDAWRQRAAILRHWPILSAFALFGVVGFTVPYYVGLQFTIAVNATLMNASGTIWIVVTTFLMTGETITRRQTLGVALGLFGTLTIVLRADYAQLARITVNTGDLLVLAGFFSWAVYTAMLRWQPRDVGGIPFLVAITAIGSVMMLPLYLLDLVRGAGFEPTKVNVGILAYSVIFPSFLSYICWNRAVSVVGPGVASMAQYMIPVFGTVLAVLILGEIVETFHVFGVAIIFAGVWLVTAGRGRA